MPEDRSTSRSNGMQPNIMRWDGDMIVCDGVVWCGNAVVWYANSMVVCYGVVMVKWYVME